MSKPLQNVHEGNAFYKDFVIMTMPLLLLAFFFYGPRTLVLALVAVVTAKLTDRFASMLRSRRYDSTENSSVYIALIIALLMPASVRYSMVVAAVLVAILVGKEAFGGYHAYPFNPAAVGYCVAAVSWPGQILRYPAPLNWMLQKGLELPQLVSLWRFENATLVEGPSTVLMQGGLPKIDFWNLLLGNYPGPMGVTYTLVILACAIYLLLKKRISIMAPAAFLATVAVIAFVFPRYVEISWQTWPQDIMIRLQVVKYEGLSGAMGFAAVYMVCEPATLPKNTISQLIYGLLLGLATMMFRYFGNYELGVCFALLIVNAVSGYFDRAIAGFSGRRKAARQKEATT